MLQIWDKKFSFHRKRLIARGIHGGLIIHDAFTETDGTVAPAFTPVEKQTNPSSHPLSPEWRGERTRDEERLSSFRSYG